MKSNFTTFFFLLAQIGYAQGFLDTIAMLNEDTIRFSNAHMNYNYNSESEYQSYFTVPSSGMTAIGDLKIAYGLGLMEQTKKPGLQLLSSCSRSDFSFSFGKLIRATLFFSGMSDEIEKKLTESCKCPVNQDSLNWSNDKYAITYYRHLEASGYDGYNCEEIKFIRKFVSYTTNDATQKQTTHDSIQKLKYR